MIRWTDLAPWEFEFPVPGSLPSTFLVRGSKGVLGAYLGAVEERGYGAEEACDGRQLPVHPEGGGARQRCPDLYQLNDLRKSTPP